MPDNPHISLVVHCAGPNCDVVKQSTNHWLICHITDDRFLIKPWADAAIREEDNILPLCSDQCATKMLARYLSDMKAKSQSADPATEE